MLFQSDRLPHLMFKSWSPISFGAWAILLFGACAFISWLRRDKVVSTLDKLIAALGGLLGFFLAGYTGVLLTVTNRPIWADSPWLGALFLASGASTAAAALILLSPRRGATAGSIGWLAMFDMRALLFELLILVLFVASLWPIRQVWVSFWGLLLVLGVLGAGIIWPLGLHIMQPGTHGHRNTAVLVLVGGFLLRMVTLLASNGIEHHMAVTGVGR
jgi:formate-dependent nitrite reductase membrane component NrfD